MNHSDVRSRMADYLDGDLLLDERALVDAHLDSCRSCALDLSELQGTVSLLRSLPTPEPPPDLAETIIERLRAGEGRSRWQDFVASLGRWLAPPRLVFPATAVAAAAAVFLVVGDGRLNEWPTEKAADEIARPATSPATVARIPSPPPERTAPVRPQPRQQLAALEAESDAAGSAASASEPEPLLAHARVTKPVLTSEGMFQPSLFGAQSLALDSPRGSNARLQSVARPRIAAGARANTPPPTRDALLGQRLDLLRRDPAGFAGWLNSLSRAERDLWLTQIAMYSTDHGIEDAVIGALREVDDPRARALSDQFATALGELSEVPEGEVAPLR